MPHATSEQPLANGERRSSQFLDHLASYPVVSDGIDSFRANPYGKKSIELADSAYARCVRPVEPYLETPRQYAAPYAKKADELADSGLSQIETRFPIVKQDTSTIVGKGKELAWWPLKVVDDGRMYVWQTYNDEYEKTASHKDRGAGFGTLVLAIISTELKLASDFFQAIADFLGPKYEEGKQTASQYADRVKDEAAKLTQAGQEKLGEAQKKGEEKADKAKQEAQKTKDEAQKKAQK